MTKYMSIPDYLEHCFELSPLLNRNRTRVEFEVRAFQYLMSDLTLEQLEIDLLGRLDACRDPESPDFENEILEARLARMRIDIFQAIGGLVKVETPDLPKDWVNWIETKDRKEGQVPRKAYAIPIQVGRNA